MAEIRVKENETLDNALRRFKRQCVKSGIMTELRKREHYEKPSVKRKKKAEAARKRKYKYLNICIGAVTQVTAPFFTLIPMFHFVNNKRKRSLR